MSIIRKTGSYSMQPTNTKAIRLEGLKTYKEAEFSHMPNRVHILQVT